MNSNEKIKWVYQEGETVLCYHGPLLYEAKCTKTEIKNKTPQYLIHYSGWNKSWDEWVSCNRVLKFNEENLKKQQELLATHGTSKIVSKIKSNSRKSMISVANLSVEKAIETNESSEKSQPESAISPAFISTSSTRNSISSTNQILDSRKKRQKIEENSETLDTYLIKNEIKIDLPNELKQILNDDHAHICSNNKLIDLPSINTVEMILNDYVVYKLEKKFDKNVIKEIANGLIDYFNTVLYTKLLFNQERQFYNEYFKSNNKKPSEVYGSIHFLRLFVKIGVLLSYTYWDEISIKQITLHINDVIKYLNENRSALFSLKNYKD